jgi:hypothetical protein
MAVSQFPEYGLWVGLSTDSKPTLADDGVHNGDRFLEIDTSKEYRYNLTGTAWVQFKQLVDAELEVGDLQIGAVEIKNSDTDDRVEITSAGRMQVESVYSSIVQGNLTLDGNTQQLHADTACRTVTVQADPENTGYLYVGNSNLTGSAFGAKLSAGSSVTLSVSNVNLVYVKGTSSDAVSFIGEV